CNSSLSSGDRVTPLTQVISWSATGAGHRLRMKAPIRRIVVLGAAVTIERPILHGRVRPIVGKSQDHAVAWSAIRAIDVGVKVTMVLFVKQFRQALIAYGQIRRDAHRRTIEANTFADDEIGQPLRLSLVDFDFGDLCSLRRASLEISNEILDAVVAAFEMNFDALFAIQYPSRKRVG